MTWETRKLGEVAYLAGRIGWKGLTAKEYTQSGPLFTSVHSLNHGDYVDFSEAFHISQERYDESPEIMLAPDDTLICKDGAGIGKLGIVGELPGPATINSSLLLIRALQGVHPKFLYHTLCSPIFQKLVQEKIDGATTPHLYQREIREFPVLIPPLPEQRRIVAILDEAFEGIDTAVASAEKNLANARELFESYRDTLFEGAGHGWAETTLGEVCKFHGGSQPPKSVFSTDNGPDKIRLIQIRDYKSERHVVYISATQARRFCDESDVMIGRYGPPLFQILRGLKGAYNVALMKAVPNEKVLSKDYLFQFLKNRRILRYIIHSSNRAAGQIGLNKETIEPYPIAVPDLNEQAIIVKKLEALAAQQTALERVYESKIDALAELKQSILQRAFAGELNARSADTVQEAAE